MNYRDKESMPTGYQPATKRGSTRQSNSYYDEKHRKLFSREAKICSLCGYPMDYNNHTLTDWEHKWSTHEVCRDKAHKILDRLKR